VDLARRRLEQLQARGLLWKWLARQDLQTIEFLEGHPERKFPEDARAWLMELLRILWIGDPGNYRILRVLVLDGKMPEPQRSRALRSSANFVGAVITVLLYLGLAGIYVGPSLFHAAGASPIRIDRMANLALFCTMGGLLIAILMYHQFQRDFRKLEEAIQSLD
jgi:hypothetical protein